MAEEAQIYRESHLRSILKGLSWRVVATTTTVTIAYLLTGDVSAALSIGAIEFFVKFFVYYGHERMWAAVPPGAVRRWFSGRGAAADDADVDADDLRS